MRMQPGASAFGVLCKDRGDVTLTVWTWTQHGTMKIASKGAQRLRGAAKTLRPAKQADAVITLISHLPRP